MSECVNYTITFIVLLYKYRVNSIFLFNMETSNNDNIIAFEHMVNAKLNLDGLTVDKQDDEYINIVKLIKSYLSKRCNHNIVSDLIDISETYSKTIYYCDNCSLTFENP